MMVEFDYMLETNLTINNDNDITTNSTIDEDNSIEARFDQMSSNIFLTQHPLEDAMFHIDTFLIPTLQDRLPNGDIPEGKTMPDVKFNSVNSRFINMCFTKSDACKWVKSRIKLSFVGDRPKAAMERVTLNLVQEYMQDINESNLPINAVFVYPMIHSSTIQLEFSPVEGPMSVSDITDLQSSFFTVYNAIVAALDGDTDVSEAFFVYQDVLPLQDQPGDKLLVNIKYFGKCRYCSEPELAETINESMESNDETLLWNLQKESNSTYFQRVTDVSFSVPDLIGGLDATPSSLNTEFNTASKKIPWMLYAGALIGCLVLITGVVVITKDQKELLKEEASTGEESSVYEERQHEGHEGSVGDVLNTGNVGQSMSIDDLNDCYSSTAGSRSDGDNYSGSLNSESVNTSSVNSKGMRQNYEVYVF